jgi:hypothetical protein
MRHWPRHQPNPLFLRGTWESEKCANNVAGNSQRAAREHADSLTARGEFGGVCGIGCSQHQDSFPWLDSCRRRTTAASFDSRPRRPHSSSFPQRCFVRRTDAPTSWNRGWRREMGLEPPRARFRSKRETGNESATSLKKALRFRDCRLEETPSLLRRGPNGVA